MPAFTPPSFISLLEYGEETLHCEVAYLFFDRTAPERDREKIIRDFKFMGFEMLAPSHPKLPVKSKEYLFMAYELDCDLEED